MILETLVLDFVTIRTDGISDVGSGWVQIEESRNRTLSCSGIGIGGTANSRPQ